jgi:2-iminobutanoate/2-iminopropanoate deaminase
MEIMKPRTDVQTAVAGALVASALVSGWFMGGARAQDTIRKEFIGQNRLFSQAVVVRSGGVKTIYIAGQVGDGDDLKTQMNGAYQNVVKRLAEAGAKPEDLVQTTFYIVDYKPEHIGVWRETLPKVLPHANLPTAALIGVQSLAGGKLFEIEAIAVAKE